MKLYVTRHGQVTPKVFEGSVDFPTGDIPLSETGQTQAACLGHKLRSIGFSGRIISSPYRRTMMTASLAADKRDAPIFPDGALREMFFSDEAGEAFSGMTIEELRRLFPHIAPDALLPYPWWTTKKDTLPGLIQRLSSFWEPILSSALPEVLVVGHGASVFGSMAFFSERYGFGFPKEPEELGDFLATRNLNCNLSCIEIDANGHLRSARLFATDHLPDSLLTSNSNPKPRPAEICF
ncbi:MAG: histidine phosphatase family protein [Ruminococcaceae bacterium]|nr:histidine phosphatase family protein [Oscillospiraceae bacterium]